MITRKDYKKIAEIIASFEDGPTRAHLANCFALVLSRTYQNFNVDKFINACNNRG